LSFDEFVFKYLALAEYPISHWANFNHVHDSPRACFMANIDENDCLNCRRNLLRKYLALYAALRTTEKELQTRNRFSRRARVNRGDPGMARSAYVDKRFRSLRIPHFTEDNAVHRHAHARSNALTWRDSPRSICIRFARPDIAHMRVLEANFGGILDY
jgi:hypothetical protein